MNEPSEQDGVGKFRFEGDEKMFGKRISQPLVERILLRCPRIASMLTALGAKSVPHVGEREQGVLAAMMAASRSIDVRGGQRKNYRFHIRPMS